MNHNAWSLMWKTDYFLAVCCHITRATGLEYIFARKCPLPLLALRSASLHAIGNIAPLIRSSGSCLSRPGKMVDIHDHTYDAAAARLLVRL